MTLLTKHIQYKRVQSAYSNTIRNNFNMAHGGLDAEQPDSVARTEWGILRALPAGRNG